MESVTKGASYKNIWYGTGRQRIEIPKSVLRTSVLNNPCINQLYLCGLGYYPKAEGHYTYRKKGLKENFLFYCVDGNGWYQVGDKKFTVKPNEFFILPANTEHAYGSADKDPWTIYWIHFSGEALSYFNQLSSVEEHYQPHYIRNGNELITLFSKMYKTLELGYSIDNMLFVNMCLAGYISMFIHNNKHFVHEKKDTTDCVEHAILYMQEHLNENISLNDLSKIYNYSTSRFSTLFKKKTGYAPIDYFIQMKMQKASQKLDLSNESVKSVAMEMGFDDPYYFSRRFRKIIGMSPKKYRSIHKD